MIKVTARPATEEDVVNIFNLLLEFHDEMPELPVVHHKLLLSIRELVKDGFIAVAYAENGELAGSIGLNACQWWFGDEFYLSDRWTYVRKRYRRTKAVVLMFRCCKEFSDRVGLPMIIGIFNKNQQQQKNRLFGRHFDRMGEVFAYGLKDRQKKRKAA